MSIGGIGAVTFGLIRMANKSIDSADGIGKLSARLGASTEALSQYKHVADLSGVSFKTLSTGWQRMTRRISDAAKGTGVAKKALVELGISAKDLNELKPEDQFEAIAEALSGVKNQSDKVRLSMKIFDSEGVSLLQTMNSGAAGIRKMREEANALGLTLSKDQVQSAERANDAITKLKGSFSAMSLVLGQELTGSIEGVSGVLTKFIQGLDKDQIKVFVSDATNGLADFMEGVDRSYSWLQSSHLAEMGLVGYVMFGKKGLALAGMVDWANTNMAKDLAQNWDYLNTSDVTGKITDKDLKGYQLGDFNRSGGNLDYLEQKRNMEEKYGGLNGKKIDKTNSLLEGIVDALRKQDNVAVAG